MESPKPAADAGEKRMSLVTLHPKMSAREGFDHAPLNLDEIVSCHSEPFRQFPYRLAAESQRQFVTISV